MRQMVHSTGSGRVAAAVTAVFLILLFLAGCNNPMGGSDQSETAELVTVRIRADVSQDGISASSTITPGLSELESLIDGYQLLGKSGGDAYQSLATFESLDNAAVEVAAGDWDFRLLAESGGKEILQGEQTGITISQENQEVSFILTPLREGDGGVKVTITLPANHGVSAVEASLDGTAVTEGLSLEGDTVTLEREAAAGEPIVAFSFKDSEGNEIGSYSAAIWVRKNIVTVAAITLSENDLAQAATEPSITISVEVQLAQSPATISFSPAALADRTVAPGETLTVTASVDNGETVTAWEWYMNGSLVEGENGSQISIDTTGMLGQYELTAVATIAGVKSSGRGYFVVTNDPPDNSGDGDTGREWTIMLFLNGDNDLEPFGIRDINEAEYGFYKAAQVDSTFADRVSMVVQFDRYDGSDNNTTAATEEGGGDWTDTRRYLIKPDSDANDDGLFTSQRVDGSGQETGLGEKNMGDAAVLKEFIQWGKQNYPAENYALIIWNHGDGVKSLSSEPPSSLKAVSFDETDTVGGESDTLYVSEITDVLTENESVDLLGMDACLMGMAEIAYEYRSGVSGKFGTDYYVASPPTEPGDGWEYQDIIARMAGTTASRGTVPNYSGDGITPEELARIIVEEYGVRYSTESVAALSAIDTSKMSAVKSALDTVAAAVAAGGSDVRQTVEFNIRGAHNGDTADGSYGGSGPVTINYFGGTEEYSQQTWYANPHFDLYDFAERLEAAQLAGAITSGAASLKSAVDTAVITSWGGPGFNGAAYNGKSFVAGNHGLGFFFPAGDYAEPDGQGGSYSPDIAYMTYYTSQDLSSNSGSYGKLDFLTAADGDGTVDGWLELIKAWYDPDNSHLYGSSF